MAVSETPNRSPGGGAEHHAVVLGRAAHARAHQQQAAEAEQAGLEGDHGDLGEVRVRAVHRRQRDAQQHQAGGGQDSPTHWRRPTSKPNSRSAITAMNTTPAARETWITDIGASRQRGDVQAPAGRRREHAQREPLGGVQRPGRAQRVQHLAPWRPSWLRGTCRRTPRFATKAQASARSMPRSMVIVGGRAMRRGSIDCGHWLLYSAAATSADRPSAPAAYPSEPVCKLKNRSASPKSAQLARAARRAGPPAGRC